MRRNVRTDVARDILRLAIIGVWAAEPEDVSLLHVLFYIRSAGSLEILTDTEGGAQQDRIVGGSQLISLRMAEQLGAAVVELVDAGARDPPLATPASPWSPTGSTVERASARSSPCRRRSPAGSPTTRRCRRSATGSRQRMAQGSVVKCMAVYERPFWRERGLSGAVTCVTGPVSVGFDNSPPDGSPGVLLGFLEGRAARQAADLPAGRAPPDRRRLLRGASSAPRPPSRSTTSTAPGPPTSGRAAATAASCRRAPGPTTAPPLREPIGPIHWAGAETALVWNGYMDGAVGSGQDAAHAVEAQLG